MYKIIKRFLIPTTLAFVTVVGLAFLVNIAPKAKAVEATPLSVTTPSSPSAVAPVSQSSSPDVAASGLAITNTDGVLSGTFTMTNTTGAIVTGVNYEILLLSKAPIIPVGKMILDAPIVYERVLQSKSITLSPKEAKKETISYKLPPIDKGDYRLRVKLLSANGRYYGWDTVNFKNDQAGVFPVLGTVSVNVKSIDPMSKEERSVWMAPEGVNIDPGQEFSVTLNEVNTSSTAVTGRLVMSTKKDLATNASPKTTDLGPSTFGAKSDKNFNLPIVAEKTPGVYIATIALYNEKNEKISVAAEFRYVVKGLSVSIVNATLDKYENSTAKINFTIAGAADRETSIDGKIVTSILKNNSICSTASDNLTIKPGSTTAGTVQINTDSCAPADSPELNIEISDKNGEVLDNYVVSLPAITKTSTTTISTTPTEKSTQKTLILGAVLVGLLVIILGITIFAFIRNKKSTPYSTIVLLLFLFISSLLAQKSSALRYVDAIFSWRETTVGGGALHVTINTPLNESNWQYGMTIPYEATVRWLLCDNSTVDVSHDIYISKNGGKIDPGIQVTNVHDTAANSTNINPGLQEMFNNTANWDHYASPPPPVTTDFVKWLKHSGNWYKISWLESTYVASIQPPASYPDNNTTIVARTVTKSGIGLYNIFRDVIYLNFTHPLACSAQSTNEDVTITATGGNSLYPIFKFFEGTPPNATLLEESTSDVFTKSFATSGRKNITVKRCDSTVCASPNLFANPGFEEGNTGFTSSYRGISPNDCDNRFDYRPDEGEYLVSNNPHTCHNGYEAVTDHGNMLIVNTAGTRKNFWCQNVPVQPNQTYLFGVDMKSAVVTEVQPSRWKWLINDVTVIPDIQTNPKWTNYQYTWTAGPSTTQALVCGQNIDTNKETLDLVVDNVSFTDVTNCSMTPNCEEATCAIDVAQPQPRISVVINGVETSTSNGTAYPFSQTVTNQTSGIMNVYIKNVGTTDVFLDGATPTGTTGAFPLSNWLPNTGVAIPAGGTTRHVFDVSFHPTAALTYYDGYTVNFGATASTTTSNSFKINFTGVGTPKPVDPTTLSMTINGVAGPVNVAKGTKVTLGWTTDNNSVDQSCTATVDDTNSTWKGLKPGMDKAANTEQVTVNKTTKYDVTCNSVTRSVTATVQDSTTGTNIRDL